MKLVPLLLVTAGALLISGCHELGRMLAERGYVHNLGRYAVDKVEFVSRLPPYGHNWPKGRFLKIKLVSSHRLYSGYPTYWVGVASDHCPMKKDFGITAIGVFDDHGAEIARDEGSKRIRKSDDGNYHYQVFVPVAVPRMRWDYNIIRDRRDICMQIFGGDHFNVFARSSVIRIPFRDIEKASVAAD